jgi:hypothetical protein
MAINLMMKIFKIIAINIFIRKFIAIVPSLIPGLIIIINWLSALHDKIFYVRVLFLSKNILFLQDLRK